MSRVVPFRLSRTLGRYPGTLLGICVLLLGMSLLIMRSAGLTPDGRLLPYFTRQAIWAAVGLSVFGVLSLIPYDRVARRSPWIYLAGLLALAAVFVVGTKVNGARRWFAVGPIRIQPSELMKYVVVLAVAHALALEGNRIRTWSSLAKVTIIAGIPFLLVAAQPDLGTALTYIPILGAMVFVAGARLKHLLSVGLAGLACLPIAWVFLLRDYQKGRILSFLEPGANALGGAYQTTQSVIAVGAGGAWGRGFLQGTQGPLGFLPERHTDFIFAVICEDFGLLGGVIVLGLYAYLLCTLARIARQCRDLEGRLIVSGVAALIFMQVAVNVGMALGVAPVTGLTLPLLSYGGSSLVSTMVGFGLVASVACSRRLVFHTPDAEPTRSRPLARAR
jgi:rod shape determining protein RodA